MVFIDLEKGYDRVPSEVMWWGLEKKQIRYKYIEVIKDIYNETLTNARTIGGDRFTQGLQVKSLPVRLSHG